MQINRGRIRSTLKVVIYGPEGIGKSTLASQFPDPVFIDTEGSTQHMDVARTNAPQSYQELLEQVRHFQKDRSGFRTLVIDTADWAEKLCKDECISENKWQSIESPGYGKGYVVLMEKFGTLLNELDRARENGMHVVLTAHAMMRKFDQPDEMGQYDRWELKLEKKTAPLVKEWSDMLLFATYKTIVVAQDDKGRRNKAQGGRRILYTSHHPCWDAKNRFGLPEEIPMDYREIARVVDDATPREAPPEDTPAAQTSAPPAPEAIREEILRNEPGIRDGNEGIPPKLRALMEHDGISKEEIREKIASKGFYPADTDYAVIWADKELVGWLCGPVWASMREAILRDREEDVF